MSLEAVLTNYSDFQTRREVCVSNVRGLTHVVGGL